MGDIIRCIAGEQPKQRDLALAHAEFAFNSLENRSTKKCAFAIVYTKVPNCIVDLLVVPRLKGRTATEFAEFISKTHKEVKDNLAQAGA